MLPVYAAPLHRYAAPLRRWLRARGYTVAPSRPPEALSLLEAGKADAAMAPLASLLARRLPVLSNAPMVYTLGETMSSIVVSKHPISSLDQCPAIALTAETRTSAAYLALYLEDYHIPARLVPAEAYTHRSLLRIAPCSLLLGDNALHARSLGLNIVADTGSLIWTHYRAPTVYAATTHPPGRRPQALRGPPWPTPTEADHLETARTTGLDPGEAKRYHKQVRLDYNKAALLEAAGLLRRALPLLEKRLAHRAKTLQKHR